MCWRARARGDTLDEDRLIATCPKVTYRMNDPAFSQRMLTMEELVKAFVADIGRFLGWLELLGILRRAVAQLLDDLIARAVVVADYVGNGDAADADTEDHTGEGSEDPLSESLEPARRAIEALQTGTTDKQ